VTPDSAVTGLGELDPTFPQFHTNSNGLGSRHNGDQCLLCHAQPTLGGSGGFLVPNPGQGTPLPPENPMFRLVPNRFGKKNVVPSFEQQYGPIRELSGATHSFVEQRQLVGRNGGTGRRVWADDRRVWNRDTPKLKLAGRVLHPAADAGICLRQCRRPRHA
jgi:hypothetical protein